MPESDYHDTVKNGIVIFGKKKTEHISYARADEKLFINHPTKRNIRIEYQPDATYTVLDRGRKYTFQVMCSQLKDKRQIEADIFRAFLCPEVSKLIIVAPDKKSIDMVHGISSIIEEKLLSYGLRAKALPITIFIRIPYSIKTTEDVVKYLEKADKESKLFI